MARLIVKSPYLKPKAVSHIENYVRYIATRDGAEPAEDTTAHLPLTKKQEKMIGQILNAYPDAKELHEYGDFLEHPTRGNGEAFILSAAELCGEEFEKREDYVRYIAQRPRVEKLSTHGLFTDEGDPVVLAQVAREVAQSKSNIWTHIISLRREDAQRLGYDNAQSWMHLLRSQRNQIAQAMGIAPENFRWYAAFHNEGHHPHVHMMAYSVDPKEAYLTPKGIEEIKAGLAKEIFRQDLIPVYQQQTAYRDALRQAGKEIAAELAQSIRSSSQVPPKLETLLLQLSRQLKNLRGKKVYAYLPPEVKKTVDGVLRTLAEDVRIRQLYELWYQQREEILKTYVEELPPRVPLENNPEFQAIKNAVIREAQALHPEQQATTQPEEEQAADLEPQQNCPAEGCPPQAEALRSPALPAVVGASLRLLQNLSQLIQNELSSDRTPYVKVDRKRRRKLAEKKHAQGLRLE